MRKKIFLILFIGIGLFAVITTSELVLFFKRERSRLIDQQVEVLATSLLASGVFESRFEAVQSQVSKALGTRETVAFLSVYDRYLNLRFRNPNAQILFGTTVIKPKEKWITTATGDHKVRLLNLRTHGGERWIQIGMLIDQENAEWDSLAARAFLIVIVLLFGVAAASYFISKALLRPLSELAIDLRTFSRDLDERKGSEEIFSKWVQASNDKDAFNDLLSSLVELRARFVGRIKINEATLSQMAHELKTPLAVIRAGTESLLLEVKEDSVKQQLEEIVHEVDRLSETIGSFLNWSRFQQTEPARLEKHELLLGEIAREISASLEHLYPNRIKLNQTGNFALQAHRPHLEQVIQNIILNALKYSTDFVEVNVHDAVFSVKDRGEGIPEKVLQRVGEPFNSSASGTGLGLAWVKTLCDRNSWQFILESSAEGTVIEIHFI
ncbi:MAG: HAMP domain-containing sensor histidine kinase [Bdellovibrionota bacterium]